MFVLLVSPTTKFQFVALYGQSYGAANAPQMTLRLEPYKVKASHICVLPVHLRLNFYFFLLDDQPLRNSGHFRQVHRMTPNALEHFMVKRTLHICHFTSVWSPFVTKLNRKIVKK